MGVILEAAHRPLLPKRRSRAHEITGRHGNITFGEETYDIRRITLDIAIISRDINELRAHARDVAFWLSSGRGNGLLIFDDEPERGYTATIYDEVDTEQLIRLKRASVTFDCQPFAKSIHAIQSLNSNVRSGRMLLIQSHGTQATPPMITITNTGSTNTANIRLHHWALKQ